MVPCMMTDSRSEIEGELFLLAAAALTFGISTIKANDRRRHPSVKLFCLTFSLSVDLFQLCTDWSKASLPEPDTALYRHATRCDI